MDGADAESPWRTAGGRTDGCALDGAGVCRRGEALRPVRAARASLCAAAAPRISAARCSAISMLM
jgi:hypothetical protein